ncbi:MAG TPA: hypothetical protein VIH59_31035 [Candidatus Tectomicrobia bacterium]
MPPVLSALLAFVVALCRSRASLCLENLALRHQVAIYKQTIPRPRLHPTDHLFWAWLSWHWFGWQKALAFVQLRTVIAWQRQRFRAHWRRLSQRGTPGRPALAKEVRDLIRQMWQANPTGGSPRIVGELRKLGIEVAKSTVEKYRLRSKQPPSPTWKAFLKNHVQDLVALDCFVVPTVTFRMLFVLVILAHERRRIIHFSITEHPTAQWTAHQVGSRRSRGTRRHAVSCAVGTASTAPIFGNVCAIWASMDCPQSRLIQPAACGQVIEVPEAGGLHHHYERVAACKIARYRGLRKHSLPWDIQGDAADAILC